MSETDISPNKQFTRTVKRLLEKMEPVKFLFTVWWLACLIWGGGDSDEEKERNGVWADSVGGG